MSGPLVVLAIPALLAGLAGGWLSTQMGASYHLHLGMTPLLAAALSLGGLGAAALVFRNGGKALPGWTAGEARRLLLVDRTWAACYQVGPRASVRWLDGWIATWWMA